MSALSKVFVILNLVLSIVFATFVTYYYKHAENWHQKHDAVVAEKKAAVDDLSDKLSSANKSIESLKGDVNVLKETVLDRNVELERSRSENTKLNAEVLRLNDQNREQTNAIERMTAEISRKGDEIRQLNAEINQNRQAKEDAVRKMEQAVDAAHEWELQCNEKDNLLLSLREHILEVSKELDQHKMVLQEMAHQGIPVDKFLVEATPLIEGRVTGVLQGVVMISVGSDDNVRQGYEFTVFRDDRYLCKIRVDKVFQDEAAGEVVPDSLPPESNGKVEVKVNDHVSTRL